MIDYEIRTIKEGEWKKLLNEWQRDYKSIDVLSALGDKDNLTLIVKRQK